MTPSGSGAPNAQSGGRDAWRGLVLPDLDPAGPARDAAEARLEEIRLVLRLRDECPADAVLVRRGERAPQLRPGRVPPQRVVEHPDAARLQLGHGARGEVGTVDRCRAGHVAETRRGVTESKGLVPPVGAVVGVQERRERAQVMLPRKRAEQRRGIDRGERRRARRTPPRPRRATRAGRPARRDGPRARPAAEAGRLSKGRTGRRSATPSPDRRAVREASVVPPSPSTPSGTAAAASTSVRRSGGERSPASASAGSTPYMPQKNSDLASVSARKFARLRWGITTCCGIAL